MEESESNLYKLPNYFIKFQNDIGIKIELYDNYKHNIDFLLSGNCWNYDFYENNDKKVIEKTNIKNDKLNYLMIKKFLKDPEHKIYVAVNIIDNDKIYGILLVGKYNIYKNDINILYYSGNGYERLLLFYILILFQNIGIQKVKTSDYYDNNNFNSSLTNLFKFKKTNMFITSPNSFFTEFPKGNIWISYELDLNENLQFVDKNLFQKLFINPIYQLKNIEEILNEESLNICLLDFIKLGDNNLIDNFDLKTFKDFILQCGKEKENGFIQNINDLLLFFNLNQYRLNDLSEKDISNAFIMKINQIILEFQYKLSPELIKEKLLDILNLRDKLISYKNLLNPLKLRINQV
jgi:hypothetical protein